MSSGWPSGCPSRPSVTVQIKKQTLFEVNFALSHAWTGLSSQGVYLLYKICTSGYFPDHFRSGLTSGHIYILSLFCAINACDFNFNCSNENVPLSVDNIIASCFELGHPVVLYWTKNNKWKKCHNFENVITLKSLK